MIEIAIVTIVNPYQVDAILADIDTYTGLSTGGFGSIARLEEGASQGDVDNVTNIMGSYDLLGVVTDKAVIVADGVEVATITATAGVGDTSIRFDVWDSTGDHSVQNVAVAVAGGEASYQFETALAETYNVFAYGNVSNEMGSVEVVAND